MKFITAQFSEIPFILDKDTSWKYAKKKCNKTS